MKKPILRRLRALALFPSPATARLLAALLLAAAALPAFAQEAAPQLEEDPRAAKFHDVERGAYAGFESGYLGFFDAKTADASKFPYAKDGGAASGFAMGVHGGYDVNPRLSLSIFALGANATASITYGAFDVVAVGADARFAFWVGKDSNDVDRLFAYVHGRAGYVRSYPSGLFTTNDVLIMAGPGLEYFTRLRHFSVGIAADFVFAATAGAAGFAVLPDLRYTF